MDEGTAEEKPESRPAGRFAHFDYQRFVIHEDTHRWLTCDSGGLDRLKDVVDFVNGFGPDPVTVGVFGQWGSGKTSILRGAEHYFRDKKDFSVCWFDPWKYQYERNLVVPLLLAIRDSVSKGNFKGWETRQRRGGFTLLEYV